MKWQKGEPESNLKIEDNVRSCRISVFGLHVTEVQRPDVAIFDK